MVNISSVDIGSLIQMTYELSSTDRRSKMALQLYDSITEKLKTTEAYQWPPTARELEDQDDILTHNL